MKRLTVLFVMIGMLVLSACNLPMDPIAPAQGPDNTANSQSEQSPQAGVTFSPSPTPEFPAEPSFQTMKPGDAIQFGKVKFTLAEVKLSGEKTIIRYQVRGLPEDYLPAVGLSDPVLLLPDGQTLAPTESGGGGGQGIELVDLTFAPLPAGTQEFTLVLPNSWNGSPTNWKIPIKLNP